MSIFRQVLTWGLSLMALAAAAAYLSAPLLLGPKLIAEPVVRADFVQTVVASGHVEAPFRINIGTQITDTVADVPVNEGETVRAGEVLIRLEDREARAAVVQAEGALAQAEARLRQLRELTLPSAEEGLKQAQATLLATQQAHERAERLAKDGFGTKAALDDAVKALEIARAQVRNAQFVVFTNRPGGSDFVLAETQVNQARANLATAQSRLGYTVITAPRAGVLISRNVERGNVVQPANVLMVLSPAGDSQLVVQIDEKNLGLIVLGQKALASTDAYPKDVFLAEVVFINPGVDLQRASVEVKLRVLDPPATLRQDMTVSVDIETARRPAALILPATSLGGMRAGRPWVTAIVAGKALQKPVALGLVSAGKAEILDGLEEGDLILSTASNLKNGARVRPVKPPAPPP